MCQAAQQNPNGIMAESTNSVLAHELIEAITDPDPGSGWVAVKSLIANGAEPIGNSCCQFAGVAIVPVLQLQFVLPAVEPFMEGKSTRKTKNGKIV